MCGSLKDPHCSMAISAEHIRVKIFSTSPAMVTSPIRENFGTKNSKQTDKKKEICRNVFVVIFLVVIFKIIDYQ